MKLQRQNYPQLGLPAGPYVHAVAHQNVLYTSGLTAYGTDSQSGSIGEQAKAIFEQLKTIAEQHDTSFQQLIKVTIFVSDLTDISTLRDTLFNLYGEALPASSLVKVDQLFAPDLLIEIEAILAL